MNIYLYIFIYICVYSHAPSPTPPDIVAGLGGCDQGISRADAANRARRR